MKANKTIDLHLEKTATGFSAYNEALGVFTTAQNFHELKDQALEALALQFDSDSKPLDLPSVRLKIDLKDFFKYYRVLNANYLARQINMNPSLLSQYVNGNKRASFQQTQRILKGIHQIGQELSAIELN